MRVMANMVAAVPPIKDPTSATSNSSWATCVWTALCSGCATLAICGGLQGLHTQTMCQTIKVPVGNTYNCLCLTLVCTSIHTTYCKHLHLLHLWRYGQQFTQLSPGCYPVLHKAWQSAQARCLYLEGFSS